MSYCASRDGLRRTGSRGDVPCGYRAEPANLCRKAMPPKAHPNPQSKPNGLRSHGSRDEVPCGCRAEPAIIADRRTRPPIKQAGWLALLPPRGGCPPQAYTNSGMSKPQFFCRIGAGDDVPCGCRAEPANHCRKAYPKPNISKPQVCALLPSGNYRR